MGILSSMTSLDLLIAGVLGLSILLGLMRGLISEVLNLAGWVVSFVLARAFAETAGQMLPLTADTEALRWAGGFVVVLVGSWLGFALLKNVLSSLVRGVGLGGIDRLLGMGFGLARGGLLVNAAVLLAGLTDWPKSATWQASVALPFFERTAWQLRPLIPSEIRTRLQFPTTTDDGWLALPQPTVQRNEPSFLPPAPRAAVL